MIEPLIIDRFTAFDHVRGNEPLPFKLDGDREPRADIPQWQINRTNARSVGRRTFMHTTPCRVCGSLERLTHKVYAGTKINKCFVCSDEYVKSTKMTGDKYLNALTKQWEQSNER